MKVNEKHEETETNPEVENTTSERKRLANRANGRKSRGPKTARGKSYSRWNRFQHGFYSKVLNIANGKQLPDYEDFHQLHQALREEFNPQSVTEELDLEEFAVNCWRRRRALKTEFEFMARQPNEGFYYYDSPAHFRYGIAVQRELAHSRDRLAELAARNSQQDGSSPSDVEPTDIQSGAVTATSLADPGLNEPAGHTESAEPPAILSPGEKVQ